MAGPSGAADRSIDFDLSPQERFLVGVRYSPPTLRLRPTVPQRLRGTALALAGIVAVGVVVGSALADRTAANLTIAVVVVTAIIAAAVAGAGMWLTVVEATPTGLSERRLWRRRCWTWAQMSKVTVVHSRPSGWRVDATPSASWRRRPQTTTPMLVLSDRSTYSLDLLTTTSRRDGFSLGRPSAADIYATLLERYRATVTERSAMARSMSDAGDS